MLFQALLEGASVLLSPQAMEVSSSAIHRVMFLILNRVDTFPKVWKRSLFTITVLIVLKGLLTKCFSTAVMQYIKLTGIYCFSMKDDTNSETLLCLSQDYRQVIVLFCWFIRLLTLH